MTSLWLKTAELPRFPALEGDCKTHTLIIGGGIAGILCAYLLTQEGVDCLLVEADRIGGGITKNTTAKVTSQHGLIYHKLLRTLGPGGAGAYLRANQEALKKYHALCSSIDCDFREEDAYVYSRRDRQAIRQEAAALQKLGFPARFTEDVPLPFPVAGAVCFPRQGQFHPLKFLGAIARELPIREHTKVRGLAPGRVETSGGVITAENIIVATHFPILNKHGGYFLKLYQSRSYVLALENAPKLPGMYVDEDTKGLSFRSWGELLLLGGGGHRTGKKGGGWQELEAFAKEHWPKAKIAARWAAQDCMTLDGIPYIGEYARGTRGLYVITGFNKWGMTSAMVGAMILRDLVLGRENPYAALFSPSRGILHPQLGVNLWESAVGLLTPMAPRCPHMGCVLKYNAAEHSWDCPCHGSRFGEDGQLIDNPATDDKKTALGRGRR